MTINVLRLISLALGLVAVFSAAACQAQRQEVGMEKTPAVTPAQWQAVAEQRVLFGHQSVGRNILDGVKALASQAGVTLPIQESRGPAVARGLTHFAVGSNGDPLAKINDFAAAIDGGAAADVALMKLCYIDFSVTTDPAQIAAAYCDTLDALRGRHPQTTFVAVTVPLTTVQGGPKALVKRMLGRTPDGQAENQRRHAFNEALRARNGAGRLFDLAALESGHGGQAGSAPCLDPALTSDGGHLNDHGSRLVAAAFVGFLADLRPAPEAP